MTAPFPDTRPFTGEPCVTVVLPNPPVDSTQHDAWANLTQLLKRESAELAAETGAPVRWAHQASTDVTGARMLIGPSDLNPALRTWRQRSNRHLPDEPYVAIDHARNLIAVDAPSLDRLSDAFQLLRTAVWTGAELITASIASSAGEVLDRIDAEVRRTFPDLATRVPHWNDHLEVTREHMAHPDDLGAFQRLMAHLDDAHSWAKDPRINGRLPYDTVTDDHGCRFWNVPVWTAAWELGIRPGDQLLRPEPHEWKRRAGSTPHAKPWVIGYRMLAGRVGEDVELSARRADGRVMAWAESIPSTPWREPIKWRSLDRRTGYLRIHIWQNGAGWHESLVAALDDLASCDHLIVDLRGNVGGALVAAQDARDRFLERETPAGTICFSTITGEMAAPEPLIATPPPSGPTWSKPVRLLVDPLCYSATEDFLLGLQGLPHVELVGQRTGGGSGRPRTIALRPHLNLTISTALTFDRSGRCIEGKGLAPDIPIAPDVNDPDATLRRALRAW